MLSFIIPWKDPDETRRSSTGAFAVADHLGGNVVLVNDPGGLSVTRLRRSRRLRVVVVARKRYFNKPSQSTAGAGYANHPLLFFCDCDILLEPDVVSKIARLAPPRRTFATVAHVQKSHCSLETIRIQRFGCHMTIKTQDGVEVHILHSEEETSTGPRNAPGVPFVKRDDRAGINGDGGFLHGWGSEDQDMICRLTLGLGLQRQQHGALTHLSHGDRARLSECPPARTRWENRDRIFRTALTGHDRNRFPGKWTEDVEAHSPRERARL